MAAEWAVWHGRQQLPLYGGDEAEHPRIAAASFAKLRQSPAAVCQFGGWDFGDVRQKASNEGPRGRKRVGRPAVRGGGLAAPAQLAEPLDQLPNVSIDMFALALRAGGALLLMLRGAMGVGLAHR
ncbi:hypothetical protein PLESTB_000159400 [Pleodorina starrii]|uniref:Uncharacterized protein n=1 Tax=Pleodorina starrii TaxID=330485 RepID=A0A9W6BB75_9CHLO|nr:hypothetical protein PLESTM_000457900 [Pleodorina starrii]GLC48888.1 hypothetical protein PLESTB_000159400 [Pleodorina starrii]GLC72618.1 hypothetical protein PLESTF_001270900 [Pleodorina starrii]